MGTEPTNLLPTPSLAWSSISTSKSRRGPSSRDGERTTTTTTSITTIKETREVLWRIYCGNQTESRKMNRHLVIYSLFVLQFLSSSMLICPRLASLFCNRVILAIIHFPVEQE